MKVSSAGKRVKAMLDNVRDAVIAALLAAELPACAAYPRSAVPAADGMICVGIAGAEDCSPGFAGYLGQREDPESGTQEVYGLRCGLSVSLDIYAPLSAADAAGDCLSMFDTAAGCIDGCGIRLKSLRCGEPAPDRASGMMHLRGEAKGMALLIAISDSGDDIDFSNFVLKGELNL